VVPLAGTRGGVADYVCGGEETPGRGSVVEDPVTRKGPPGAFGSGPLGALAAARSSSVTLLCNLLTSWRSCTADNSETI